MEKKVSYIQQTACTLWNTNVMKIQKAFKESNNNNNNNKDQGIYFTLVISN